MSDILPTEMWLNIFKYAEVEELFKKRKVCKYFKLIVDNNLKYFYNNFSRIYPKYFCKINNKISHVNFIKGFINIYIEGFENCSPFYINKFQNTNITFPQAKLILNLYRNHNIEYYFGIKCIDFNSQQIEQMIKLKDIGIPHYFCISMSEQIIYTDRQFNVIKKLKELGVSEFYSRQIALTFTDQRLEYFYSLVNNNTWFVVAFHMAEEKIF